MKKASYILGIGSLSIILIATIFKAMHFPGAGILLTIGIGFMSFIFLPIAYAQLLKSTDDKLLKWVYHAAFISFFVDFIGMLFKIMHWPGANILMLIGVPLPFVLFLPVYVFYHTKRKLKTDVNFFGIILFMIYLGVFSSLLAVRPSEIYFNSIATSAEAISKSNELISKQLNVKSNSLELVQKLDKIKIELAIIVDENNNELVKEGTLNNFTKIQGKDKWFGYDMCQQAGLSDFNLAFEDFKTDILSSNKTAITQRLINEIDTYRVAAEDSDTPVIGKLSLINTLNVLTDWQNKILLIDYVACSNQN